LFQSSDKKFISLEKWLTLFLRYSLLYFFKLKHALIELKYIALSIALIKTKHIVFLPNVF